jgi:hypothetical protein
MLLLGRKDETHRPEFYSKTKNQVGMPYSNAMNAHPQSSCTPCKIEIYSEKSAKLSVFNAFFIALALTLRNWTLHMTTKPSNRMIHVHDMLTLKTESREVSHAANSHIS